MQLDFSGSSTPQNPGAKFNSPDNDGVPFVASNGDDGDGTFPKTESKTFSQVNTPEEKTGEVIRYAQSQKYRTFKFEFFTPPIIGGGPTVTITGTTAGMRQIGSALTVRKGVPDAIAVRATKMPGMATTK